MTTQKFKVLGIEQGITITRPFNNEMYAHNDRVREIQNEAVKAALDKILEDGDEDLMFKAGKACSGYGYGMGYEIEHIYKDALQNAETQSNNWMREDIWPDFLKLGLVQPIEMDYVGYKKL
jgi:hypothetical protein